MDQKETLCFQVPIVIMYMFHYVSTNRLITLSSMSLPSSAIPVLSSPLILNYVTPFIVATWFPPEFTPDNYNVSTSCQWFCDTKIYLSSTVLVSDMSTNPGISHKIPHINAGSRCTVSVLAVFGGNTSNKITSSMNTPAAGLYRT